MRKLRMYNNPFKGLLITFCGLDGCGKTTMITRLASDLRRCGGDVMLTRQPTDAVRHSEIFRNYMDSSEHSAYDYRSMSVLAASDRLQHVRKVISPALDEGRIVISDRYFYSCLANLRARGYGRDVWIYDIARHIIRPDAAFFLDIDVPAAVSRVRARPSEKDRYIDMPLQYRLRDEYLAICRRCGGILVPTDVSEDSTYEFIRNKVEQIMEVRSWN